MYFIIAGYNTMPKAEKAKHNIEGIATLFKNTMFGMALIIIIGYFVAKWLENTQIEIISMFLAILIGIPYLLINSNSDKSKINNK